MNPFKKWAEHEFSKKQRLIAVVSGGVIFWVVVPLFIFVGSSYMDVWLRLPKYRYGSVNVWLGLLCIIIGWLFANWTVNVQYSLGKGTPIPLMATQKLVVKGPYAYCRNPMTLGTAVFYMGVAIWIGSPSALGLGLIYPAGMLIYIKLIEEKELKERFGFEYLEYKKKTPFLIPRFRKADKEQSG